MSDLHGNDFAVIVNKHVISDFAVTEDMTFGSTLLAAEKAIDDLAGLNPLLGTFIRQGLDDPVELAANLAMPAPRLLFATTNPAYPLSFGGPTDRANLFERLRQFDMIASGPVLINLPPDVGGFDNPVPIKIKADKNARFTFFRPTFFSPNIAPEIHVTGSTVTITITGQAFRGDVFSAFQARHAPTHTFSVTLSYTAKAIEAPPYAVGVNFVMTSAPPPGNPPLPAIGQVVYATQLPGGKYVMPQPLAGQPSSIQFQALENGADAFHGQIDDLIYEPGNLNTPVYRVEPMSATEPTRPVLRKIGSSTVLAEGRGGRITLRFAGVSALTLTPLDGNAAVTAGEMDVIKRSLIKIDPTLAQVFLGVESISSAFLAFSDLDLLGATGFDIPITINDLMLVTNPRIDKLGNGSVSSTKVEFNASAAAYYPDTAFGVYGVISGSPGVVPADFSSGADLSTAVSQHAANGILQAMAQGQLDQITAQASTKGIPLSNPKASGGFMHDSEGDGLFATVSVHGSVQFLFFSIGFDVNGFVRLNLRVQPTIVTDPKSGAPLDVNGCTIPPLPMAELGLDYTQGQLQTADPSRNPFCFVPYFDPLNGLPSGSLPPPERIPPPIYKPNGDEIPFLQALNQSICTGQRPPDSAAYGQASFPPFDPQNQGLKHHQSITVKPPTEKDVNVSVNVDFWGVLLNIIAGIFLSVLSSFIPFVGPVVGPLIGFVTLNALILLPFIDLIASAVATGIARDMLSKVNRPVQDVSVGHSGLFGLYLEDPLVRTPVLVEQNPSPQPQDDNALVTRFHVVLGVSDTNFGLKV